MKPTYYLIGAVWACLMSCKHEPVVSPTPSKPDVEQPTFPAQQTPKGQPQGAAVTQTIGPAGGSISLPDQHLTLHFPAGALSANTVIKVQPLQNTAVGGIGPAFELEPKATLLHKPIDISWQYSDEALNGTGASAIGLAEQLETGEWLGGGRMTLDQANRLLTTQWTARNLSRPVAYYAQFYLKYAGDEVVVNQPMGLTVAFQPNHSDELESIERNTLLAALHVWEPVEGALVDNWRINGEDPLNQTTNRQGNLGYQGQGEKATYFAPSRVPPQRLNPIAISVELKTNSRRKVILVANLTVVGDNAFQINGTTFANPHTWVSAAEGGYMHIYLEAGDPLEPNHPGGLGASLEHYHGPGTYAMRAEDSENLISASEPGKEGKLWSAYYHQTSPPYGTGYGHGTITITSHDRQTGVITGHISAGLYHQPDRGRAPNSASASGRFRAFVQTG
ncbi:hypothetical protein ACAW74_26205 [Fibrella sp. WM1]|uniref:hypothetical protein n=1 Tax=Fibrella musci TaxID=3242485 RepID=UPI00351F8A43